MNSETLSLIETLVKKISDEQQLKEISIKIESQKTDFFERLYQLKLEKNHRKHVYTKINNIISGIQSILYGAILRTMDGDNKEETIQGIKDTMDISIELINDIEEFVKENK